jgi:hypothetical protein
MLSAGFDADVIHRLARWRSAGGAPRKVSRLSYVRPLATALYTYAHAPVAVDCDGAGCRGAYCVVSNLPEYALALSLTPPRGRRRRARLDGVRARRPAGSGRLRVGGQPRASSRAVARTLADARGA